MNNNVKKVKVFKKWFRTLLAFSILFIACVSVLMMINGVNKTRYNESKIMYAYNTKENVNYKVNIHDNDFIEDTILGENQMYISNLVKDIDTSFNYTYSATNIIPLRYEYSIIATITGKYKINNEDIETKIWTKQYILKQPQIVDVSNSNSFNINENINIDYNFFDNVVSEFRKELHLSINAVLNVKMKVSVKSESKNIDVNEDKELYIEIPLNQQAFEIEKHFESNNSKTLYESNDNIDSGKKIIIFSIITFVADAFLLLKLYPVIFNIKKKNNYNIILKKIMKDYGEIIVEVLTPVSDEDLNVVQVKNFNEMVDLEEELRIPIMFYEKKECYEGEFVLVHNNILYKYTLTNDSER